MEQRFKLVITTPSLEFFNDYAEAATVTTTSGSLGILANIMPLVACLQVGILRIKVKNKWMDAIAGSGFLTIRDNKVSILCDTCVWEHDMSTQVQEVDDDAEIQKRMQSIKEHHNARSQMIKNLSSSQKGNKSFD